ncbi:MAG: hypothetical protein JRN59_05700 [Nitrososphaerota archaeon]|nr:hypothetical protein [Nitrososphaerota archaeon]
MDLKSSLGAAGFGAENRSTNKVLGAPQLLLDRGMTVEECRAVCTCPDIPLVPRAFFRVIYETTFRPFEVLNLLIENWNKGTGELTAVTTKKKYNPKTDQSVMLPRSMCVIQATNEMLRHVVGNRKKGLVFLNPKSGRQFTLRHFEKVLDHHATLLNVQREKAVTPTGRVYRLVSCMALREAGERHHDQAGGDADTSARAAGHSEVKARHYKKVGFEEAQESYRRFHPAFTQKW